MTLPSYSRIFLILAVASLLESVGIAQTSEPKTIAVPSSSLPLRIPSQHLPNAIRIHTRVFSGGLPDGDEAFKELVQLGIKTIISVDGAKPDVEAAKKVGLRYVHLPHGYNGISEDRIAELAKAVRDLEGPIYVHCHHGKHRSPTAASVACVAAGLLPATQAVSILQFAGTNPNYRGLYLTAEHARALESQYLDRLKVRFQASVELPPMAEAMVQLGHEFDHLLLVQSAGWTTPPLHSDLEPQHQALLLREHFTEMLRTDEAHSQPSDFMQMLKESETAAQQLETALERWQAADPGTPPPDELDAFVARISANCKSCHRAYRDVPLAEQ